MRDESRARDSSLLDDFGAGSSSGNGGNHRAGADRNLLLGLLAFQNDFIEHDTLVDAVHAWIADKSKPLGSILRGWHALDEGQLAALTLLVEQHLKKHGNAARSLGSIDATISFLGGLGPIADEEVRARLAEAEAHRAGLAARKGVVPVGDRPACRYRKPTDDAHKSGGLGVVFIAEDLELGRQVALKEIRPRDAFDPRTRARFLLEGEVTGQLEHPGIVPVYGLGTYDDGRPYYAMRLVKGQNFKESIDEFRRERARRGDPAAGDLGLRKLLRRFIDICNAIEYAHSRKVLHRDIKPANIMLGKFGETLVVDWGLAKIMGKPEADEDDGRSTEIDPGEGPLHPNSASSVEATRKEEAHGTPQYMSPEQAAGRIDLIGPSTDVYGLGATLYFLLTGRAPFPDGTPDEIIEGRFPRPREVDPRVPRPLEAICLKAMANRPEQRYPSAIALSEDVERWLGDQPVSALRDSPPVRLARWSRGHRTLVTGSATLLVAAVVGLTLSNLAIRAEEARTATERAKAEKEKEKAVEEKRNAQFARQRAIDALSITGQAVDRLMIGLAADKLSQIPGTAEVRRNLAQESLKVADELRGRWRGDPIVAVVAGPISHLAANLDRTLGRFDEALANYRQALAIHDQALASGLTDDRALRSSAVRVAVDFAEALRMSGRPEEALRQYDAVERRIEAILEEAPGDPDVEQSLARCLYNKAYVLVALERFGEARPLFDEAVPLLDQLARRYPEQEMIRFLRTLPLLGKGIVAREQRRSDDAGLAFERALENLKGLRPSNDLDFYRARVLEEKGCWLSMIPARQAEAVGSSTGAIEILERLALRFPEIPNYRVRLACARLGRGMVLAGTGVDRAVDAAGDARESIRIADQLLVEDPKLSAALKVRGEALGLLGRLEPDGIERRKLLRRSEEDQIRALRESPDTPANREALRHHREALEKHADPSPGPGGR
jgi:serine/threonine protein kinase